MTGTQEHPPTVGLSAAISNAVVRLFADYTGRGPTKARTHISDDYIAVVLQDTLTKGERSLVRDGKSDLVLSTRKAYQHTMRQDLIAAIEQHTGRHRLRLPQRQPHRPRRRRRELRARTAKRRAPDGFVLSALL